MVADLSLDKEMLQDVIHNKALKPARRRELAHHMVEVYCCSKRRATSLVGLSRSHKAPRALHDQRVLEHGLCRDTRFNGSLRDECLNLNWFLSLDDAQQKVEAWRVDYNEYRPHQSLGDMTPNEFVTEHRNTPDFLSQSI